jgi:DNA polymerase-3 subunit epsilon
VDKYDKTDKFFLVGYNTQSFDIPFLRRFFDDAGDKFFGSYFHNHSFDVIVFALYYLRNRRAYMDDFKLATVYEEITKNSVVEEETHEATYDIQLTYEIFKHIENARI